VFQPLHVHPINLSVVVSYFAEELQPLLSAMEFELPHGVTTRVFFYNKGPSDIVLPASFASAFPNTSIHTLPNIGRCDHTFLHHLMQHYVTFLLRPQGHVLFLPASKHHHLREVLSGPLTDISSAKHWWHPDYVPWRELEQFKVNNYTGVDKANNAKLAASGKREGAFTRAAIRPYGKWFRHYFGYVPGPDTEVRVVTMGVFRFPASFVRRSPKALISKLLASVGVSSNCEEGHYMERAWHPLLTNTHQDNNNVMGNQDVASVSVSSASSYLTTLPHHANFVPIAVGVAVGLVVCGISIGVILYMYKAKRI
jgi:hypothetical protein